MHSSTHLAANSVLAARRGMKLAARRRSVRRPWCPIPGGDADEPHVHPAGGHGVVQNFIQHLRIRITSPDDTIPVMLLPRLQRFGVLLVCFLSAQWNSSPAGHFVWLCGSYYRESSGKTQGRKYQATAFPFRTGVGASPGRGRSFYRPARIKETQGEFWVDFWEILWYSAFADNRLLQKFATLAYATGATRRRSPVRPAGGQLSADSD